MSDLDSLYACRTGAIILFAVCEVKVLPFPNDKDIL